MAQCNFCSISQIRKKAKEDGMIVKLVPSTFMGGTDVFVVPKSIGIEEIRTWKQPSATLPNGCENRQKYEVSWMMIIPKRCVC